MCSFLGCFLEFLKRLLVRKRRIREAMSVGAEVEDIQLHLQSLLVTLGKEQLIALCAKFKLSEEILEKKTRLTLTKLLALLKRN